MQAFVQALRVSHISLPVCLGLWEICGWLNNVNFTTCRNSALYKHNRYYYYKCGCRNIHSYAIESFYMIVIATDFFLGCCYNFSLENASVCGPDTRTLRTMPTAGNGGCRASFTCLPPHTPVWFTGRGSQTKHSTRMNLADMNPH